jgi:SAM-dependent methyltransferase
MSMPDLPHSPAADRNKEPILALLRRILGHRGTALEIAAGTGQHAVWFAASLPDWTWQPTDCDAAMLPVIADRIAQARLANVLPPRQLDVTALAWPQFARKFDAIYCANMLHIAPWDACPALMAGAARHLAPGGMLVTYGPYFEQGVPPAPGNLAFDESLRARDPSWGIRDLDEVVAEARRSGLVLAQRHAMPANNLLLVFTAASTATADERP